MAGGLGRRADYRVDEVATRGHERALAVTAGPWGGAEIRPTRLFVWLGPRDRGHELVLPTGLQPRLLRAGRHRRHLRLGGCQITFLGNPLLTLGILGYNVVRRPGGAEAQPSAGSGRDPATPDQE